MSTLRVTIGIDTLGAGGAEESTLLVAPLLAQHKIHANLLLHRSTAVDREEQLDRAGVTVKVLQPRRGRFGMDRLRQIREIRQHLKSTQPDLWHVTLFDSVCLGALAAVGTGIPVLVTMANTPPTVTDRAPGPITNSDTAGTRTKIRLALMVEGLVLRHLVSHVHAVTSGVATATTNRFRVPSQRISVVQRGRDQARFTPPSSRQRADARADFGLDESQSVIAVLARHEPSKGLDDLVEAISLVRQHCPQVRVLLAGRTGSESAKLQDRINHYGLTDHLLVLGNVADPERVLAAADLYVLPSRREGASGATLEAMAMQLPIVATAVAGLNGVLTDGHNALVVPIQDPKALAEAIGTVLSEPHVAHDLGQQARLTYLDGFTVDQAVTNLAALYRKVAAAGR